MKALAVATGIVFWTLVIGIAVLAFFPGSDAGDPVAILQIEPAAAPSPAAPEAPASEAPAEQSQDNVDLPPGFAVPSETPKAPMVEQPDQGRCCRWLPARRASPLPRRLRRQTMPPRPRIPISKAPRPRRRGCSRLRSSLRPPHRRRRHRRQFPRARPARSRFRRCRSPNWSRNRNMARCRRSLQTGGVPSMSMRGRPAMPWPMRETRLASPSS